MLKKFLCAWFSLLVGDYLFSEGFHLPTDLLIEIFEFVGELLVVRLDGLKVAFLFMMRQCLKGLFVLLNF